MVVNKDGVRLRLVGCLYQGSPDQTIPFLIDTFPRLTEEVKYLVSLPRQIQYASGMNDDDYIHFLGVEVEHIDDVPKGMMAWNIDGDSWTVIQSRDEIIWQETLHWEWLDTSIPDRPCGEFNAKCPAEWQNNKSPILRSFRIQSQSYLGAPANDDIFLVDYNPTWPEQFEQMKQYLQDLLGIDVALRIEHYGSTSIPDTPAKPVIDILVEVPSFGLARERAIPAFNTPEIEYWCSDHIRFYIRDKVTGIRTCHLHMAPVGHRIWEGLAFRDYLRIHREDAARYVALKRELVEKHPADRLAYTNAKEAFVREITDKALGMVW